MSEEADAQSEEADSQNAAVRWWVLACARGVREHSLEVEPLRADEKSGGEPEPASREIARNPIRRPDGELQSFNCFYWA